MAPPPVQTRLLVFNAAGGLPNTIRLIQVAKRARAALVVLLRFETSHLDADIVRRWTTASSQLLQNANLHLATFNADLILALGRSLDLTVGAHPIAINMWLIVRLWSSPVDAVPAVVTLIGPATVRREGIVGSLWADELLKPDDLSSVTASEVVIADFQIDVTTSGDRMPGPRNPWELHTFLGPAVAQRASTRTMWAAEAEDAPYSPRRIRPGEHAVVRWGGRGQRRL